MCGFTNLVLRPALLREMLRGGGPGPVAEADPEAVHEVGEQSHDEGVCSGAGLQNSSF